MQAVVYFVHKKSRQHLMLTALYTSINITSFLRRSFLLPLFF